jgi:hypothetical protein
MKFLRPLTLILGLSLLSACAIFETNKKTGSTEVPKKVLAVPISKNWQVIEEAPALTNERTKALPSQTEESLQPQGPETVSPTEKRKIETPAK